MTQTDVLVVGAGPTGLVLALWLDAQGVKVRILDKSEGPGTTSRAVAVQARTLELYRQLGIGDAVAAAGHKSPAVTLWAGGKRRAHLDTRVVGADLTPYPFPLVYPQDAHERFLIDRLRERGVEVERRTELLGFEDDGHAVAALLRSPDGTEETCTAGFIAGCDGARSIVRKDLGASFAGGTYGQLFYVADVEADAAALRGEFTVMLEGPDFVLAIPYGEPGRLRLIGTVREERLRDGQTPTFADVAHRAVDALGLGVAAVHWFSTYHVHHRVADRFRRGRAFLLGDAAHVHSPAGGQGMNTGIGDAINLAWKLAAVVQGRATDDLLDSYEAERTAFARRLVETTDRVFTFVTARGSLAEFLRVHVAPLVLEAAWGFGSVREAMFRIVSQTMIHYQDSPLSEGKAGSVAGGDRLPFVRCGGGDNYDPLPAIGWQVQVYGEARDDLPGWCREHGVALRVFDWHPEHGRAGLARHAAYLLRPDTHVGLADPEASPATLQRYCDARGIRLAANAREARAR